MSVPKSVSGGSLPRGQVVTQASEGITTAAGKLEPGAKTIGKGLEALETRYTQEDASEAERALAGKVHAVRGFFERAGERLQGLGKCVRYGAEVTATVARAVAVVAVLTGHPEVALAADQVAEGAKAFVAAGKAVEATGRVSGGLSGANPDSHSGAVSGALKRGAAAAGSLDVDSLTSYSIGLVTAKGASPVELHPMHVVAHARNQAEDGEDVGPQELAAARAYLDQQRLAEQERASRATRPAIDPPEGWKGVITDTNDQQIAVGAWRLAQTTDDGASEAHALLTRLARNLARAESSERQTGLLHEREMILDRLAELVNVDRTPGPAPEAAAEAQSPGSDETA